MNTTNYIYDNHKERGIKAFEKRVSKLLKNNSIEGKEAITLNAYMERANGRGSYYRVAEIQIDGEVHKLRDFTNDSMAWDGWENPTPKEKRQLFEAVLFSKVEELKEV